MQLNGVSWLFYTTKVLLKTRYSVCLIFSQPQSEWSFVPADGSNFPDLDVRDGNLSAGSLTLSITAIEKCLEGKIAAPDITHLITVSCTGMSAPGLDLQIAEAMQLAPTLFRTSVNFMGCYAAIHALKLAKMICDSTPNSHVVIVGYRTMHHSSATKVYAGQCCRWFAVCRWISGSAGL